MKDTFMNRQWILALESMDRLKIEYGDQSPCEDIHWYNWYNGHETILYVSESDLITKKTRMITIERQEKGIRIGDSHMHLSFPTKAYFIKSKVMLIYDKIFLQMTVLFDTVLKYYLPVTIGYRINEIIYLSCINKWMIKSTKMIFVISHYEIDQFIREPDVVLNNILNEKYDSSFVIHNDCDCIYINDNETLVFYIYHNHLYVCELIGEQRLYASKENFNGEKLISIKYSNERGVDVTFRSNFVV